MPPSDNVRRDRAVGAVLASAAGDALGAPHEFGRALPADTVLEMTGGGALRWDPGEWTDDTQTALAVLSPLSRGAAGPSLLGQIEQGLLAWSNSGPRDIGNQTRAVLSAAVASGEPLAQVTAGWQARHPDSSGNGSLMRTGPVALAPLGEGATAALAAQVSSLTHAGDDALEACVLWTTAVRRAIDAPAHSSGPVHWLALVSGGLGHLREDRRQLWRERLEACAASSPESFTPNGWVVSALQGALSTLIHTDVPAAQPCRHLRAAVERAVRIGDDTDTVAAITGSLAGGFWGATAVPVEWRRTLHGRIDYDTGPLGVHDLDRLARLAFAGGKDDPTGWPSVDSMLHYYQRNFPAAPLAVALDEWVTVGNVYAVADQLDKTDVVVSLCRMGRSDVPGDIEHHVIGLLDTTARDNPNLGFVLADTAEFLVRCADRGRRVFVHCVRAENRTPAVAAAYLVKSQSVAPDRAIERILAKTGARPQAFLVAGVQSLAW